MQYRLSRPSVRTMGFLSLQFCLAAFALTACGPAPDLSLKGVDVSTSQVGADTDVSLEAIVSLGSLQFPDVEFPVVNPKTFEPLGELDLQHLSDGTNRISISVDYSQATQLDPSLGKTLPNGREIPLALGAQDATLVGIPALENSRIYVGGDLKSDLFVGVAIAISAFDSALNQVPLPLNIFFSQPFSSELTGIAGLFTGTEKGQNGIAVFAKRSAPQAQQEESTQVASDNELEKLDSVTMFRLNRLFHKRATLRIK